MQQTDDWLKENRYVRDDIDGKTYFWRDAKGGIEGYLANTVDRERFDLKPVGKKELESVLEKRYGEIALV